MPTIDTPTAEGATNVLLNQRSLDPPYYRQAVGIQGDENAGKAIGFDDNGVLGAIDVGGNNEPLFAEQFGAVGDGVTNDYEALNNLFAQMWLGKAIALSNKVYCIDSPIIVPANAACGKLYGNKATIKWIGATNSSTYMLSASANHFERNNFNDVLFDCDSKVSGIKMIGGTGAIFSMRDNRFNSVWVWSANGNALAIGDFSVTGHDVDAYANYFHACWFNTNPGGVNVVLDADNALNVEFHNCTFNAFGTEGGVLSQCHILAKTAGSYTINNCFFGFINEGYAIEHCARDLFVFGMNTELARILHAHGMPDANCQSLLLSGVMNNDGTAYGTKPVAVWAETGHVTLTSCSLGRSFYSVDVTINECLVANNVNLGATGVFNLTRPDTCVINVKNDNRFLIGGTLHAGEKVRVGESGIYDGSLSAPAAGIISMSREDLSAAQNFVSFGYSADIGIALTTIGSLMWSNTSTKSDTAIGAGAISGQIALAGSWAYRFGKVANAAPAAQTLIIGEASQAGTDNNVAGANGTIQSGLGTGTGTVSSLIFQTPTVAGAGSGVQTYATGLIITGGNAEVPTVGKGFILKSPDGTRYRIQVANGGALSTTPA